MASMVDVLRGFFSLIREGKGEGIIPFLSENAYVDDPLFGHFSGLDSFEDFIFLERNWLSAYGTAIEPAGYVFTSSEAALEYEFRMEENGRMIELPVAVAASLEKDSLDSLRIYYSTWPVYGNHRVRAPVLPENRNLKLPEILGKYMKAISGSDAGQVVELFEDGGYVREPAGNRYRHSGLNELRDFYDNAISGGGIPLKHCSAVSGGSTVAVEYFFNQWNGIQIPEQCGIAFYDIGISGKLKAARIYDDADPQF